MPDYSVTGIIHSISSRQTLQEIGELVLAPCQRWDALVCTSRAGQEAVKTVLNAWLDYLAGRLNARPRLNVNLPVIPLGIDCSRFDVGSATVVSRARLRQKHGIGADDIAVLFVGRLSFKRKCHPIPMYQALQKAQVATGARIHFLQAGHFEDPREEDAFREAAVRFSPDIRTLVVGGSEPFRGDEIWFAADIFLSLSDNIQETFGLAPVEAMAAGLPCVVSDWNGYRDTVRDGIDGFLVPTTVPPPGAGLDLVARYLEVGSFRQYYANVAMNTAVDPEACASALVRLMREPDLRRRMGDSGRQRARTTYDWPVVLKAYHRLWRALAKARRSADMVAPLPDGQPPYPLCDDPFRTFAGHASQKIGPDTRLAPGSARDVDDLQHLRGLWISRFGSEFRVDQETAAGILEAVAGRDGMTVSEILRTIAASEERVYRTIAYMLKFGLLRRADN
jgi:glycosyltransferase involved in cell wall biosynthesis